MQRFYVEKDQVADNIITITGTDVNHIKNVLRMRQNESILICDGLGTDYHCKIEHLSDLSVKARIQSICATETELPTKIYLFQGLPKKDKMELIVQKAVELGAVEIIPVMMKRTVVKLEDKKKELKKIERWQSIAVSAAKQSSRGIIPKVSEVISYKEALQRAKELEYLLLPYENEKDMVESRRIIKNAVEKKSLGIFIGPEGGFEDTEVAMASEAGVQPITLGNRILRTETAGLAILSILMFELENE